MATAKLVLLLAVVSVEHYGTTAPNDRPPNDELREQKGPELALGYFTATVTTVIWTWALIEGSLLFALSGHCPPALSQHILDLLVRDPALTPTSTSLSSLTRLTPAFLTGTLLSISGGLLRAYCFRTLGRFFTFELSIRREHALITHGAYSIVRHPSYTGGVALAAGLVLCMLESQGWIVACSGMLPGGGVWVRTCLGVVGLGVLGAMMRRRIDREDAMLEKNFGEEWRAWAKRVPYKLVPGVY